MFHTRKTMTGDFAEDFCDACAAENEPYLIVYRTGDGGLRVRYSLENYVPTVEHPDLTKEADILSVIELVMLEGE